MMKLAKMGLLPALAGGVATTACTRQNRDAKEAEPIEKRLNCQATRQDLPDFYAGVKNSRKYRDACNDIIDSTFTRPCEVSAFGRKGTHITVNEYPIYASIDPKENSVTDLVSHDGLKKKSTLFDNVLDQYEKPVGKWKESLAYQKPLDADGHNDFAQSGCSYLEDRDQRQ